MLQGAMCGTEGSSSWFGLFIWQPPIEAREDGGVQSYCEIARTHERFTGVSARIAHVLCSFPISGLSGLAARGRRGLSRTGYEQRLLGLPTSCARRSQTEALPPGGVGWGGVRICRS